MSASRRGAQAVRRGTFTLATLSSPASIALVGREVPGRCDSWEGGAMAALSMSRTPARWAPCAIPMRRSERRVIRRTRSEPRRHRGVERPAGVSEALRR
jgi:hypothetical protein